MGHFGAIHGWMVPKKHSSLKICYTYPTMIKLDTSIPYLKKIQKIYISHAFCHRKSANFALSRNTDK